MSFASLRDVETETSRITLVLSASLGSLSAVLRTGQATDAQLGALQTNLTETAQDLRTLRDNLGLVDVSTYQIQQDPADRIGLWEWQLGALRQFRRLVGQLQQAQTITTELRSGRRPETYVVRAGETLQSIAAKTLGDWREWDRILEANGLDPAATLSPGLELIIPERR